MSSIKLTADSGGGTFEIKAPASGSNARVLTVPDSASGTVLTTTNPKAGNIIQVLQSTKTDTASRHNTSYGDTGLSQAITTTGSNKVLITLLIAARPAYLPKACSCLLGTPKVMYAFRV